MEPSRIAEGAKSRHIGRRPRFTARRQSVTTNHMPHEVKTYQNDVFKEQSFEIVDDSDSDVSQAILTPVASSSDEDDAERFKMVDHLSSQSIDPRNELLHQAIRQGSFDVVKDELKRANIEMEASDSCTPLVRAINYDQPDVMQYILKRGANVHHRVKNLPPIAHAVLNGTPRIIQLLMDFGADPTSPFQVEDYNALQFAAIHEKIDAVDFLIHKGLDLEQTCLGGRTAFLLAAEQGHLVVMKLLLAEGAELHVKCSQGRTALAYATRNNHIGTTRYLLEQGLDVEDQDDAGISKLKAHIVT